MSEGVRDVAVCVCVVSSLRRAAQVAGRGG